MGGRSEQNLQARRRDHIYSITPQTGGSVVDVTVYPMHIREYAGSLSYWESSELGVSGNAAHRVNRFEHDLGERACARLIDPAVHRGDEGHGTEVGCELGGLL